VNIGTCLALSFAAEPWSETPEDRLPNKEYVDFDKEPGKVIEPNHSLFFKMVQQISCTIP